MAFALLGWSLVALAFAGQSYLAQAKRGVPVNWNATLGAALADWYAFAALSLPAIWLARRYGLGGPHWRLRVALHLVASVVFSLSWMLLRSFIEQFMPGHGQVLPFREVLRYVLVATFFFNMLVYWVVVTGVHAVAYYRNFRDREVRILDLEKRLTTARLEALQMQLNPHFLFNALNGISTLMYRDVTAADSMLVKLSELLRQALDRSAEHSVTLRNELAFLDRYLALEKMRFGDRLLIRRDIRPETLDEMVPNLVLQPLVENALKHGLADSVAPGTITLRSLVTADSRLRIEVEDNGRGFPASGDWTEGIGLGNCRARLRQLYGERGRLQFDSPKSGGAKVVIEIPRSSASGALNRIV